MQPDQKRLLRHINYRDDSWKGTIRGPRQLRDLLAQRAKHSGRSINSELKIRLADSLITKDFIAHVPNWQEK